MTDTSPGPWEALFARIPQLTATDGEWHIAARKWNGVLRLGADATAYDISIAEGTVVSADPAHGDLPEVAGNAAYFATSETWRLMLQPTPAPPYSDPAAAAIAGGVISKALAAEAPGGGDATTARQYWPALRRLVEILREAHHGGAAVPVPAKPARASQFDSPIGRYVRLVIEAVEYRVYFEEAGQGIPLLLHHTAGADGRQWRHLFEDAGLLENFRLIAYDLPFHGRSLPPEGKEWWTEPYRLTKDFVLAVPRALSAALELDRPVVMGSSVGGQVAVDLAYHFPAEFRAVIGLEASLKQPEFFDPAEFYDPRVPSEFKVAMNHGLTSPTAPEAYRRETSFVYNSGAPFTFSGDLNYWMFEHDLQEVAQHIDTSVCSVHLLTGEYDTATPPALSEELAAKIPGATFAMMEGLGHFPMSEDPDRFLTYVRPILLEIAGAASAAVLEH